MPACRICAGAGRSHRAPQPAERSATSPSTAPPAHAATVARLIVARKIGKRVYGTLRELELTAA
jgi:hypothetical protein